MSASAARWGPRLVLGATIGYIGGHVAAYALGWSPDRFFGALGYLVGVGCVVVGLVAVLVQLGGRKV